MSPASDAPPRDRLIDRIGCLLVALPLGTALLVGSAALLHVPPAGLLLVLLLAGLLTSGSGGAPRRPVGRGERDHTTAQETARRTPYGEVRSIVDRYERGEISAERRDDLLRSLRR